MYWLSSPALLKEWLDVVFTYNFAYGENYKLEGKKFVIAVSTGSGTAQYSSTGSNKHSVEEFLTPFVGTANYIKMVYHRYIRVNSNFINLFIER